MKIVAKTEGSGFLQGGSNSTMFAFFTEIAEAAAAASLPHFRTALSVSNKLAEGFDPVTG
jgi:hypothetical protein